MSLSCALYALRLETLDQVTDARPLVGEARHVRPCSDGQIQAGLARVDPGCPHARAPLKLACREHRPRGPGLSVRGQPRATGRAQGARSGVQPPLNYGGLTPRRYRARTPGSRLLGQGKLKT